MATFRDFLDTIYGGMPPTPGVGAPESHIWYGNAPARGGDWYDNPIGIPENRTWYGQPHIGIPGGPERGFAPPAWGRNLNPGLPRFGTGGPDRNFGVMPHPTLPGGPNPGFGVMPSPVLGGGPRSGFGVMPIGSRSPILGPGPRRGF